MKINPLFQQFSPSVYLKEQIATDEQQVLDPIAKPDPYDLDLVICTKPKTHGEAIPSGNSCDSLCTCYGTCGETCGGRCSN